MPGQAKMVSVMVVNAIILPRSIPKMVMTGIRAFFNACPKSRLLEDTPLALANLM